MKIEFIDAVLEAGEIKVTAEIAVKLSSIEHAGENAYDRGKVMDVIKIRIAEQIAAEYIEAKRSDILSAINLDQVVKGIEFKTINEFAKQVGPGGM